MFLLCCQYLLLLFAGVILLGIVGKLVLALAGVNGLDSKYSNFAAAQITGISFVTICTALYFTHGKTVLLVLVLIFLLAWLELKRAHTVSYATNFASRFKSHFSKLSIPLLVEISVLLLIIFVWQAYTFIDFKTGVPIESNADLHIVSFASNAMTTSGIERNYIFDIPSSMSSPPTPYHYFEYWFVIFFSKIKGDLPLYNLKLNQIPVFIATLYALFCILVESLNIRIEWLHKIIGAGLVFIFIPKILVWNNIILSGDVNTDAILFKTIHLLWIILIALICFLHRKNSLAIIALLSYAAVCYTALPVICCTIFTLLALELLGRKYFNAKSGSLLAISSNGFSSQEIFRSFLYSIIVPLTLVLFYKMTTANTPKSDLFPYLYSDMYSVRNVLANINKHYLKYFLVAIAPLLEIALLPLSIYFLSKRINKGSAAHPELIFYQVFVIQFLFSSLFYTLFHYDYNCFVLYRITNLPFLIIFIVLIGLRGYQQFEYNRVIKYSLIGCLLAIMASGIINNFSFYSERKKYFSQSIDPAYRQKVEKLISRTGPIGVFMKSEDTITYRNMQREYPDAFSSTTFTQILNHAVYHTGLYLDYYKPNVIMHPITFTPYSNSSFISNPAAIDNVNKTYFYSIYVNNILNKKSLTENQKRIAFIKYANAGFLMASKYVTIDSTIYRLFADSAINTGNGERFYLIDTSLIKKDY